MWQRQSPPYQGGGIQSHRTHGAPEPSLSVRRGPEPLDTWQRQSPPYQGGRVRSHWTRGDVGVLPIGVAGSGATRHMATLEPSLSGRQGLEPLNTWRCWSPPSLEGKVREGRVAARGCTPRSLS
jgi:hypothetical protein